VNNGVGAVLFFCFDELLGNGVQCLIPRNPFEFPLTPLANPLHRVEYPIRVVDLSGHRIALRAGTELTSGGRKKEVGRVLAISYYAWIEGVVRLYRDNAALSNTYLEYALIEAMVAA